jgi:hypothetical protein
MKKGDKIFFLKSGDPFLLKHPKRIGIIDQILTRPAGVLVRPLNDLGSLILAETETVTPLA